MSVILTMIFEFIGGQYSNFAADSGRYRRDITLLSAIAYCDSA